MNRTILHLPRGESCSVGFLFMHHIMGFRPFRRMTRILVALEMGARKHLYGKHVNKRSRLMRTLQVLHLRLNFCLWSRHSDSCQDVAISAKPARSASAATDTLVCTSGQE
jgi:hypothetical protein